MAWTMNFLIGCMTDLYFMACDIIPKINKITWKQYFILSTHQITGVNRSLLTAHIIFQSLLPCSKFGSSVHLATIAACFFCSKQNEVYILNINTIENGRRNQEKWQNMWYINQECLIVAMKVQLSRQWTRWVFYSQPNWNKYESKRVRTCPNFLGENKQKLVETCNFHLPFLGALYTFMCFKTNCMCFIFWETENCQNKPSKTTPHSVTDA